MNLGDMILVSVDDHIIEPGNVFDNHMPKKYTDRAPKLIYDHEAKLQKWVWEGGVTATPFICAVVTLPPMEWGYDPSTLAEMRPEVRQLARLSDLSDTELAARGLTRQGELLRILGPRALL